MKKPIVQADPNMDSLQYQIGFDAGADAMYNALKDGGGLQTWVDGAPKGEGLYVIDIAHLNGTRQLRLGRWDMQHCAVITESGKYHTRRSITRHMRINTDD